MIRCLITDGLLEKDPPLDLLSCWMQRGVDLIQIREKHLEARDLAAFTRKILTLPNPHGTKILVNDRIDVAIACGADGVHLRDGSIEYTRPGFIVSVACHNIDALPEHADYILLSPIFRGHSPDAPILGLEGLRRAAALTKIPILALGGVTPANENDCIAAGAAGIAGISYFRASA
jgi:thiamine-phosphate pyrophosphorylase